MEWASTAAGTGRLCRSSGRGVGRSQIRRSRIDLAGAILRGDVNHIHIGDYSNVQDGAVVHCTHKSESNPQGWPTVVGQRVTIGHQACLHGCTIGDRVLIGIGATVLDGAIIEDDVVIAAGALVPPRKRLESGYMYVGAPAKAARKLTDAELAFFEYTTNHYVKLQATHRAEQY